MAHSYKYGVTTIDDILKRYYKMTTLKNEVIATLVSGSASEFYTIGNKAFGLESTNVDLASQCYSACPEFYMVTPSKLPVAMYTGLSNGVVDAYTKGIGSENECFLAKVENLWQYVTKPVFEKHQGHKVSVTNNWLMATDFKKLKSGKLDFGSDDGKAIAGMAQARKDKVIGQVNQVIKRLQNKAKQLFDTTETEPKIAEFNLAKDFEKLIAKCDKFDDENPVLLKKLLDDVLAKYNK
jgi:hypothetical protein